MAYYMATYNGIHITLYNMEKIIFNGILEAETLQAIISICCMNNKFISNNTFDVTPVLGPGGSNKNDMSLYIKHSNGIQYA